MGIQKFSRIIRVIVFLKQTLRMNATDTKVAGNRGILLRLLFCFVLFFPLFVVITDVEMPKNQTKVMH